MKKVIALLFCLSRITFAEWTEVPNASNGGHPDFVNSNATQPVQSITVQNDYGTADFGVYIKVFEHERERISSSLLAEGFNVQLAIDDDDFDEVNLFPEYITVREKITDLDKIYLLLEELLKINADELAPILERMKNFASAIGDDYLRRLSLEHGLYTQIPWCEKP